jgi:hypothetical protein
MYYVNMKAGEIKVTEIWHALCKDNIAVPFTASQCCGTYGYWSDQVTEDIQNRVGTLSTQTKESTYRRLKRHQESLATGQPNYAEMSMNDNVDKYVL